MHGDRYWYISQSPHIRHSLLTGIVGATCAAIATGLPERLFNITNRAVIARQGFIADWFNMTSILSIIAGGILISLLLFRLYDSIKGRRSRCQKKLRDRLPEIEKDERELDRSTWFF